MAETQTGGTPAKKSTPTGPASAPAGGDQKGRLTEPGQIGADAAEPAAAATAIRDAVRDAEIRQLTEQRDELRKLIGDAPTLEVLRAEVAALEQVAARSGVSRTARWTMSAGVAADLEQTGVAVDPQTGAAFVRDGDRVTVTSRTGEKRTVDMPKPSGGGDSRDRK